MIALAAAVVPEPPLLTHVPTTAWAAIPRALRGAFSIYSANAPFHVQAEMLSVSVVSQGSPEYNLISRPHIPHRDIDRRPPELQEWEVTSPAVFDGNSSALVQLGEKDPLQTSAPSPPTLLLSPTARADHAAAAHLASGLRSCMPILKAIALTSAITARIPITGITLGAFTDPEEGWTKVTCTVVVRASAEQALAFWDYLGAEIDRWRGTLPDDQAALIAEKLALYVDWEQRSTAV